MLQFQGRKIPAPIVTKKIEAPSASIKYGELIVLGYNGFLPNGDEARMKRRFALSQRPEANGVKPSTVHVDCNTQSAEAISLSDQYSVSYALSQASMTVVEYAPDGNTDMFQIGRSTASPIDFVVTDTLPGCSPELSEISRFACRIVCQRSPPYTARIYAAGFDDSKDIFLGNDAVTWKTPAGHMDGLTTNGVLVMHPPQQDSKPKWREISVCGNVFKLRENGSTRGKMKNGESQELVDGSLIDLCGVTLLWCNPPPAAHGREPGPHAHLEVQRRGLHDRRPRIVYKTKKDGACVSKDPQRAADHSPWPGFDRWALLDQVRSGATQLKNVKSFFCGTPTQPPPPAPPALVVDSGVAAPAPPEVGRWALLDQIGSGAQLQNVKSFICGPPPKDVVVDTSGAAAPGVRGGARATPGMDCKPLSVNLRVTENVVPQTASMLVVIQKTREANDVCKLTLDPNTANTKTSLSANNRKVTRVEVEQKFPEHPDRFKDYGQVMSIESLTGLCYWEVEWSGEFEIAVTYRGIDRQGDASQFGCNDKSWSLRCIGGDDSYTVWHNAAKTDLAVSSPSSRSGRVAVYVDRPAGTVSFCTVSSGTLTHLHTFQTTFTEPLYAGFWVGWSNSSVRVCQREEVQ